VPGFTIAGARQYLKSDLKPAKSQAALPFYTPKEKRNELKYVRAGLQEILGILAEQGLVHRADEQAPWTWTNESYPADAVSLRSVSSDNFVVVDITTETRVIGETDFTSGPSTLHPKAIYIVEGQLFQVERLDFEGRKAFVRSIDCDYYTTAISYAKVTPIDTFAAVAERSHGEVHVVSRVVGFKKIKFYTNENIGSGELDLPEQQMHTTAYWLTIPADVMGSLPFASDDRRDGVVGLAFALRQVAQLLLMCDRRDLGSAIGEKPPAPGVEAEETVSVQLRDAIAGAKGRTAELGPAYPKYSQAMWTAVQAVLAGKANPQTALDTAQQQASS